MGSGLSVYPGSFTEPGKGVIRFNLVFDTDKRMANGEWQMANGK